MTALELMSNEIDTAEGILSKLAFEYYQKYKWMNTSA